MADHTQVPPSCDSPVDRRPILTFSVTSNSSSGHSEDSSRSHHNVQAHTTPSPVTREFASHFWSLLGRGTSPRRSVSVNPTLPDGANESSPLLRLHTASVPDLRSHHSRTPPDALHTFTACADVVEEQAPVASDMATLGQNSGDARRSIASSPRPPKGRENAKNTLCRNIGIYGHCRWEKDGCAFNHDANSSKSSDNNNSSKRLNVESPAFQPKELAPTNGQLDPRSTTISPKSATATPFTPKTNAASAFSLPPSGSSVRSATSHDPKVVKKRNTSAPQTVPVQPSHSQSSWSSGQGFQEFVPQTEYIQQPDPNAAAASMLGYSDPFALTSGVQGLTNNHVAASLHSYAQDASSLGGAAYYQNAGAFAQPAQYHNYAPLGPHRDNLLAYQRTAHDFFMPDKLREELQKKAESTLQVLPSWLTSLTASGTTNFPKGSTLPTIDHFHSLVPLDTSGQRSSTAFGYVTWLYKAQSSKDGKFYALRRLEGFRLTNEKAIHAARQWKQIDNGAIVNIHEAFTTREFGDSSLIFVTDYHPNSKTLAETHLQSQSTGRFGARQPAAHVPENVLWSYIVQLASAIKACHSLRLAVRTIAPSKIIITSKNRIRLNACGVLDVVQFDSQFQLEQLKQDDFVQLGRLVLSIAGNANATLNMGKAMEHLTRTYTPKLRECVTWLVSNDPSIEKNIDGFLQGISTEMAQTLDMQFHETDTLTQTLMSELENGRIVRLVTKLGLINERPEYEHNPQWSETGERYYLKLFRDYVFHAVDDQGRPITDLGHVISCLNKLDAGSEEKIQLCSRDEQSVFVVSYKEIKKGIENAFGELTRRRN